MSAFGLSEAIFAAVMVAVLTVAPVLRAQEVQAPATGATAAPVTAPAAESLPGHVAALIANATSPSKLSVDIEETAAVKAFYAARVYAPLWVSEAGYTARASQLIAELNRADDFGLSASAFAMPPLIAPASLDTLAAADQGLTRAVLKYARFARGGRIADPSGQLSEYIDRRPQLIAPAAILEQIAAAPAPDDVLRGFHPQHAQFQKLRAAYLAARDAQKRSGQLQLPDRETIYPGQSNPSVAILRRRLGLAATEAPEVYDPQLVEAVVAFQKKASMRRPDGIVGDKTRAALNAGGTVSTASLIANMEQWRWMPAALGATYVQVNIPEYMMRVVTNGRVIHAERVVTGKTDTATPLFSAQMQTVVFQPKWGVPDSIKINELLPRLQQGRGLRPGLRMSLNGREIDPWNVNWERADITRYHIYQPSGDDNALGVVKFLFPNKHAVYLHDTPTKNLFNVSARAFSHGCVRVRNPVRLAELLLAADKGWDGGRVRDLVEDGPEDNPIKLDTQIPVHITYFTAWVDDDGRVQTFADVYGHEQRVIQALNGRGDQIAKLSPRPAVVIRRAVARSDDGEHDDGASRPRRRVFVAEQPRYERPAALGYPQVQRLSPPQKNVSAPYSLGGRYRGNSTNDIIMRAFGLN